MRQSLRAWSDRGIVDTMEGEIPPVVERLKREYEKARAGGPKALEKFREDCRFGKDDLVRLEQILGTLPTEMENAFVSSWLQKRSESAHMWGLYGDGGKGVAVKAKLSTLLNYNWKVPLELSGSVGSNRISSLVLREVKYLSFDDADALPPIDDLHLPFLKRDEFEDEHEIRLVAFTARQMPSLGFTMFGDLTEIIDEIVVGPHSNLETTVGQIRMRASDLAQIPIRHSTIAPSRLQS